MVLTALSLALTVLGWGTGYKMSLYHCSGGPPPSIPVAKLLSQKERPSATRMADGILPAPSNHQSSMYYPAIIMVAFSFALRLAVLIWMRRATLNDNRRQNFFHSIFFFFRPPPALLPSN
jgi:hypothetical protein